jgi:UDP-glucose 4-epimerase
MILVTGGLGYIGSHVVVDLLKNGYEVVVVDNLSNSYISVFEKIKEITKKDFPLFIGNFSKKKTLKRIFENYDIEAVIHLAGFKSVKDSTSQPLKYYNNNIVGTIKLLEVMEEFNCKKIIFSSSATVYGYQENQPIKEDAVLEEATNPYGKSKQIIENILKDLKDWDVTILRYFNVIGAHLSGKIGDNPRSKVNNLIPIINEVLDKKRPYLEVFGSDYQTYDGTCIRDYVHVMDIAKSHRLSLNKKGYNVYNLGTGKGYSVLEIIETYEKVNKVKIPYKIVSRREGDLDITYADTQKALEELNFKCDYNLKDMCRSAYNFKNRRKL